MDRDTQNKINSIDATRDVLADEANTEALNSNQGFKDEAEDFRDLRAIMQPFLQVAAGNTKGITVNKKRLRDALVKKAVFLTGGGWNYARKVGDAELETAMDSNKTKWNKTIGGKIETDAQNVHDKLKAVVDRDAAATPPPATPISNYQVTAAALADFQTNIDALSLVEQGPRSQKGAISGANKQAEKLVNQLGEKKEGLKRLLPQLEDSYPQFVEALRSAMVIVDTSATRGGAKAADGGTPTKPAS